MNSGNGQDPAKRKKEPLPEIPKVSTAKTGFIIGSLVTWLVLIIGFGLIDLWPIAVIWTMIMIFWGSVGK